MWERFHSTQSFGLGVQGVDHLADAVYRVQRGTVRLVDCLILEDDQHPFALIQYATELFVQDHLWQLPLHSFDVLFDQFSNVWDLENDHFD